MTTPEKRWKNINELQERANISDGEMSDVCNISRQQYRTRRTTGKDLDFHNVCHLADSFNFGLTKFSRNDIDVETAARFYHGELKLAPSKYLVGAASKARSINNILDYIGDYYGQDRRQDALRHIQCTEQFFENGDAPINVLLSQEICDFAHRLTDRSIFGIGLQSADTLEESKVGKLLKSYNNSQEMFQGLMLDHVDMIEANNIYTVHHSSKRKTILRSQLNPNICDTLKVKSFGNKAMSDYRAGVMASLTRFQSGDYAKVEQTKCIYQGDSFSEFVILH